MVGAVNNQSLYTYSSNIKEEKTERPQEDLKEKGNGGATSAVSVRLSDAARELYKSGVSTEEGDASNAAASAAGSGTGNKNTSSGNTSVDAAEEIKESLVNAIS
ncbi:MAG: hypothetical protein HQL05_02030 [Nitrospirae bacterium]|uniref:hypothetical protein n=1 Tax=Candidatus Magnetobacterium casense TaxID=1455061 RepID=UPI00058AF08C|nr:hypothetical protein [Candidatus Magnetobacterium casensis]MBF0336588.1 hypothetical protein [Nitrospirota bacterium]